MKGYVLLIHFSEGRVSTQQQPAPWAAAPNQCSFTRCKQSNLLQLFLQCNVMSPGKRLPWSTLCTQVHIPGGLLCNIIITTKGETVAVRVVQYDDIYCVMKGKLVLLHLFQVSLSVRRERGTDLHSVLYLNVSQNNTGSHESIFRRVLI